jgi:RimJ/RimL family protein N-acetyltransferase
MGKRKRFHINAKRHCIKMIDLPAQLTTERLILRRWETGDLEPFAAMNCHPEVMRYFPRLYTREDSDNMVARSEQSFAVNGFGPWACQLQGPGDFIGFIGLIRPQFKAHFTPCVEIGWRLAQRFWGNGYAGEAAKEVLRDGFERLRLSEILSFTSVHNRPSIRVMEKIGMTNDPADNFAHPLLDPQHWLSSHVLYRLDVENWRANHSTMSAISPGS